MIRTVQIDLDVAKVTNRVDEIAILQASQSPSASRLPSSWTASHST